MAQAKLRLALDESRAVLSVSAEMEALLGYAPEDFLRGRVSLAERIHRADADIATRLFAKGESESGRFNIRLRHADGSIRCVRGEYTKENTDKQILELRLTDARHLYRSEEQPIRLTTVEPMMDFVGEVLYFKNRDHVFTAANRAALSVLSDAGKDGIDPRGLTDYDLFPEDYADLSYSLEQKVLAGAPVACEIRQLPSYKEPKKWLNCLKYAVKDGGGHVMGFFGVAHDITGHKQTLDRLRESEEWLRQAQEIAGLGSYSLDLKRKLWAVSPEVEALLGIGPDYSRSFESVWALIHPADRPAMAKRLEGYYSGTRKAFDAEYRIIRHNDGAVRWVHGRGRLECDVEGEPLVLRGTVQDITEEKQAEAALRESEESLKEAERIAGLCSYVLDIRAGVWKGSDNLEFILGISAEHPRTVAGWMELIHPEDRGWMTGILGEETAQHHASFIHEYRIVRPSDGAVRWIRGTGKIEYGGDQSPAHLRGTIQDITDSKQAEIAVRDSRTLLQLFIEHAPAAIAMLDREMRYLIVSQHWLDIHGLKGMELTGRSHYEVFPDLPEGFKATHGRVLAGETIRIPDDKLPRQDGSLRRIRRELRPWFSSDGSIGGIVIFSEDITEQKQVEAALRDSNELLHLFVEHAPVAIAMFDREMRYLAVSRRWAQDHHIEGGKILGKSHYEVNPEVPERWKETHRRGLAGETQQVEEDRYDRANGATEWIRWQITPWRAGDGTIGGIVLFYEDITARKLAELAQRESKELLQLFIDRAPAALAMFDREMRYLAVSRRWLEENSLEGREVLGRSHYEIAPDVPERWREAHRRGMEGESLRADEDRFERPDGTVQWIRWEVIPWRKGDGSIGGIILFAEDITRHRQTDERLRLAASVFTNAREGITITDPHGTILEVNDMFTRITGYSREEVLGKNPRILKSGVQTEEFYANMWRGLMKEGHWSGEIWNRHKSGELFAETLTIDAVCNAAGETMQYVALFSDITQMKKQAQVLEHMTHFDVLTSLPNRSLLMDRLHQAMAQAKRRRQSVAVAYLDLDGFKKINQDHGREAGDRLLTSLAFNMKCALREGDTLARLGGDEFVAVILDLDSMEASASLLESLRDAASEPVQVGDLRLSVSASIGVAFYPQTWDADPDLLLRQADQAMYQAKLAGGNRYHFYDPEHDLSVRGRHENVEHIRQGLAASEFVLHYQPKVNMRTGKVFGAEALIRWQHPEKGLLPPGMFLPVIEDHDLSIEIGEWVIDGALAQIEAWQKAGLSIPVSVNVGALQLQQPDFIDRLSRMLAVHPEVKPNSLVLEVLETSALQDIAKTSQVLNACNAMGVLFALDDFGTGYSSLTYLKRLPASILKIDQSFVSDMLEDPENLNILEGILSLASAFHRKVIAEGVETVEHGLMLLQLGCELAQGFGIARPMPPLEFLIWASTWRPDPRWERVPPVHAGNRALLYACVEHRAWVSGLEAYLMGKHHAPPVLDLRHCRFGKWLEEEDLAGRGDGHASRAVRASHQRFHKVAAEILVGHADGRGSDGAGRLSELHKICDHFFEDLERLGELA